MPVKSLGRLGMAGIALGLASCSTPTALSNRAVDFNKTVAQATDSQLLLNIVRAAQRNPTHYSSITQVRDSRTVSGSGQVAAQFPFGPNNALLSNTVAPTLAASGSLTPSFDVAPLDNRAAAEGLFRPVDPQIFLTYWEQDWPPMVLLFMFVDGIYLNNAAKAACGLQRDVTGNHINNTAYNYNKFAIARKFFDCVQNHLQFERKPATTQIFKNTKVAPEAVLRSLAELNKADFDINEHIVSGSKVYSISKTENKLQLVLTLGGRSSLPLSARDRKSVNMQSKTPSVSFTMRSVDGMVYYLGELVRLQIDRQLEPEIMDARGPQSLFHVEVNEDAPSSDEIVAEFLGKSYSVSRVPSDRDRSLTVLSMLSQVFSLYREEKELPKTTAVQLVGGP
jgi:hypothetical protein